VGLGEPLEQPVDGLGRMGAVAHLSVPDLEPSGERGVRQFDRPAEECFSCFARASHAHVVTAQKIGKLAVGQHDDRPRPRDGELLRGDLLAALAEDLGVLERDVRQEDDARVDHIRRVETAAEARLDHRRLNAACLEVGEGGGRERLELGRANLFGCRADARERALEAGLVGLEPFVPARDVRRGVGDAADRRGDAPGGRRFALRADHMHGLERTLRIAETVEQFDHSLGAEAVLGPRAQRLDPLDHAGSQ